MKKTCFYTQKGPKAIGPYATAVWAGDTAYLSGMIPIVPETGALLPGTAAEQAEQALRNIETVLREMGLTPASVVKATIYMTDLGAFSAVNEVYGRFFAPDFPARSCVQVAALPKGASVEIEVTAVR